MNKQWTQKYRDLYISLGLDPIDFENLDIIALREKVRCKMEEEFCRELFGGCGTNYTCCC